MKKIKRAVSYVIYNKNRSKFLIVKRPDSDPDTPNYWGLPAGYVNNDETFEKAVIISGFQKLGIKLKITKFVGQNIIERKNYILYMQQYEVEIEEGKPKVPQNFKKVTQYQKWKWGVAKNLIEAAKKQGGSLCSRIYLSRHKIDWN